MSNKYFRLELPDGTQVKEDVREVEPFKIAIVQSYYEGGNDGKYHAPFEIHEIVEESDSYYFWDEGTSYVLKSAFGIVRLLDNDTSEQKLKDMIENIQSLQSQYQTARNSLEYGTKEI